jgi:hypothetical protein
LTDSKLQSIFSDLKIHDKEEIAYKHFKSDGKDPDGLEEARLRQKIIGNFCITQLPTSICIALRSLSLIYLYFVRNNEHIWLTGTFL